MIARKNSEEFLKARQQKIQEQVHRILYCDTDWNEHEIYEQRFKRIVNRSNLDENLIKVEEDVAKEYRRRIEKLLHGKERLDKSLVFFKILTRLGSHPVNENTLLSEIDGYSESSIYLNLSYLEAGGLIDKSCAGCKLSNFAKKLLTKVK